MLINAPLVAHNASHYPACSSASLESVLTEGTDRKHVMSTLDRQHSKHRGTLITHILSNFLSMLLSSVYSVGMKKSYVHTVTAEVIHRKDLRCTSQTSVLVGC